MEAPHLFKSKFLLKEGYSNPFKHFMNDLLIFANTQKYGGCIQNLCQAHHMKRFEKTVSFLRRVKELFSFEKKNFFSVEEISFFSEKYRNFLSKYRNFFLDK